MIKCIEILRLIYFNIYLKNILYINLMLKDILYYTTGFIALDYVMTKINFKGMYYFNHFLGNMYIIKNAIPEIGYCYSNLDNAIIQPTNTNIISMVSSIHIYHILYYYKKLRYDDWLHHILMLGFSLPLSLRLQTGALLSHSLFFLSGLPGGIDYLLLFLNRNNYIHKSTEKYINYNMNLWIRSPGCILSSYFIINGYLHNYNNYNIINNISIILISSSIYWNGIYYMNQVSKDYILNYKKN